MTAYINNNFANQLMQFFNKMVIKNSSLAESYETVESKERARYYLAAMDKTDSFFMYEKLFNKEDLLRVGISEKDVDYYINNLNQINTVMQEELVKNKREEIIYKYEETNLYYLMLNGKPPIGREPYMIKGIKVTDLSLKQIIYEFPNEIKELQQKYTSIEDQYLKYLGENKIDYYTSRTTANLRPMYYHSYLFDQYTTRKIVDTYYQMASYIETVYYTRAFTDYERYTNFLIVLIIFNSINKLLSEPIRMSIRGEFDDIEALRDIFLTYNLPFDPLVSKRYLQRIVKNLNKLFSYKGTNQVLIDIVNLFGYSNITINKYYLVKNIKKDINGNFIFNGTPNEKYELKFLEIPIMNNKGDTSEDSKKNNLFSQSRISLNYETLTNDDPYWGGTDKEYTKQKLLETEFNYLNTKYLSINTMTNVTQIIQEMCYFFNFINDAESDKLIDNLKLVNTEIKPTALPIKIFDLMIAMQILICNKLGYEDLILYSSTAISSLYGFNFKGNEEEMNKIVNKYKKDYKSKSIFGKILNNKNLTQRYERKELINIFFNNMKYKTDLENMMRECNDINEYRMLEEIYQYNCFSTASLNMFKKESGSYYESYSDYLKDADFELYEFTEKAINNNDHFSAIQKLFDSVDLYLEDERITKMFLNSAVSDRLKNYIYALLSYFKAYTVDIKNFNVFYLIGDKNTNNLKFIDEFHKVFRKINTVDKTFLNYFEKVIREKEVSYSDEIAKIMTDFYYFNKFEIINSTGLLISDSYETFSSKYINKALNLYDSLVLKSKYLTDNSSIDFKEKLIIQKYLEENKEIITKDTIKHIFIHDIKVDTMLSDDGMSGKIIVKTDKLEFEDYFKIEKQQENNKVDLSDDIKFETRIIKSDYLGLTDYFLNEKQENILNFSDNVEFQIINE